MLMNTPWGKAQNITLHCDGFQTVETASHGGMMISFDAAEKHLSPLAISYGIEFDGYLCYEEDCDKNIPLLEAKGVRADLLCNLPGYHGKTDSEIDKDLMMSLFIATPFYIKKYCLKHRINFKNLEAEVNRKNYHPSGFDDLFLSPGFPL